MATKILMPALSPTMEEGTLTKWLVKAGDKITAGDVIAEIETDKATMEVESIDDGVVKEILIEEGREGVLVNTPIAIIIAEGDAEAAAVEETPSAADTPTPEAKPTPEPVVEAPAPPLPSDEQAAVPATPASEPVGANGAAITQTVREALRDAMAEEMRRDGDVFIMGEEVAEYQGAYKVTQGLLENLAHGASSIRRSPNTALPA